jgi:integrase
MLPTGGFGSRRMRVRLVGVHRVRKRLASGKEVEYHYAYRGGPQIWRTGQPDGPGTPGYLDKLRENASPSQVAGADGFRAILREYQGSNEWRKLSVRTKADYSGWIDEIDAKFGSAPKASFERPAIRPLALAWRDQWSGRQADYAWQVLRRIVGWAYDRGRLSHHHLRGGGAIYEADRAEIIWPDAARDAYAKVAPPPELDALDAALETGLRPSDLVKLDRSQVLPTPGGRRIMVKTAKRRRMASIPVTPRMAAIIDSAPAEGLILRNASGRPWTTSYLSQRVKKYAREAKLPEELHLYDCRGTACSRHLMAGSSLRDIATVFGWSLRHAAAVIESYAALNPHTSDAILARLEAASVN